MEKYLPKEVVSWTVPSAGMFVWIKITSPAAYKYPENLETNLFERCLAEKVLVIPGGFFKADSENVRVVDGVCYFRGTFAAVEEREVVRGLERLGRSIRLEFGLEMA
jgi:aromatic amino acid aminotransferase I / 2-aminoadipate transaminase